MKMIEEEVKEVIQTVRQSFQKETPREIKQKIIENEETTNNDIDRIAMRLVEIRKPRFKELDILEESLAVMIASIRNIIGENGEEILKFFVEIVDITKRMSILNSGFDEEMVRAKEKNIQKEK